MCRLAGDERAVRAARGEAAVRHGLALGLALAVFSAFPAFGDALTDCLASRARACLMDAVVAEVMARPDASDKINGLGEAAKLLNAAGDSAAALALVRRGEDIVAAIADVDARDDARVMLVQGYADAGAFAAGLESADRIQDLLRREFARSTVAIAAADAGDIAVVEAFLPEANLQLGDELRESLLEAYGETDQWERVIHVAGELVFWNPDVARWVAGELVARGYLDAALALRDRIDVIGLREFAVRGVIDGFIRRREYVIARHIAGQSQNPYHSDSALVDIATAMAIEGDTAGAERMLAEIREGETRGDGMVRLATVLAERGEVAKALAIAEMAVTNPPPARDPVTTARLPRLIYDAIARAQAAAGDGAGAVATARRINERADRNATLEAIAARRIDVGDRRTALAILDEFAAATEPVAAPTLREAVRDLGRMAETARAVALVQALRDPADRANTLLRAAMLATDDPEAYAALLDAAGAAIATIATERQRQGASALLAVLRARGRQAEAAGQLIATLSSGDRTKVLLSIAFPRQQPLP